MTNIIDFTEALKRKVKEKELEKELNDIDTDTYFALTFSVDVAHDVVMALSDMGYDIGNDPKSILELMMIIESTRALIMRSAGKEYAFQAIGEHIFKDEDGNEIDYENLLNDFLNDLASFTD